MTYSGWTEATGKSVILDWQHRGRGWIAGVFLSLAMTMPALAGYEPAYRLPPRPMTNPALVESHRVALAARLNEVRVSAGRSANEYRIRQLGHPDVYADIHATMRVVEDRKAGLGNEAIKLIPDFASEQDKELFTARSAIANPVWHSQYLLSALSPRVDDAVARAAYRAPARSITADGNISLSDGRWVQRFRITTMDSVRHVLRVTSTLLSVVKDLVNYLPWAHDRLAAMSIAGDFPAPTSEQAIHLALTQLSQDSGMPEIGLMVDIQLDDRSVVRIDEPATTTYALAGVDHGAR